MANWSGKLKKRGQFFDFAEILLDHFKTIKLDLSFQSRRLLSTAHKI